MWKSTSTAEQQKRRPGWIGGGVVCAVADAEEQDEQNRVQVDGQTILAQQAQIHLDVAGYGQCLTHIAAGQHRGRQVFDSQDAVALFNLAGQGAGVGHIADGQAGQMAGDTQLGYLHDRQGQGVSAVGLPGEGGGAVGIDAAVGHGFLIGAFLPEFHTDILAAGGTGTDSQHQQQHQRDQRCAGAFECIFHKDQPFLAARVRPALVSCWGRTQGLSTPKYHASDNMSICFVSFSQKSFTYEIKSRKNIRSPVREADIVKPLRRFAPAPLIGEPG